MDLNPKPWHIELRCDTPAQGLLIEDDIHAGSEQGAIEYLLKWKELFIEAKRTPYSIIGVCTSNWTGTCVYQDTGTYS